MTENQAIQDEEVIRWVADDGDDTLRVNYNLNKDSIVFDVGSYVGTWSIQIYGRYACNIHAFEPVDRYYAKHYGKQFRLDNVKINKTGLGASTRDMWMVDTGDASNMYSVGSQMDVEQEFACPIMDVMEYIEKEKIDHIDLMKINIEGGEYELLPRLIETGWIKNIKNVQVQFHHFIDPANAMAKMNKIRMELAKTHTQTYHYEWIWENWELKEIKD